MLGEKTTSNLLFLLPQTTKMAIRLQNKTYDFNLLYFVPQHGLSKHANLVSFQFWRLRNFKIIKSNFVVLRVIGA